MENAGKNVRIDTYDFFGYLAPGAVAFAGLVLFCFGFSDFSPFYINLSGAAGNAGWFKTFHYATVLVVVIVLCYMTGHVVATLSSLVLEKILVAKIFQYPFQRILFGEDKRYRGTSLHYRTLIVGIYAALFTYINPQWFAWLNIPVGYFWTFCFTVWLVWKWSYIPLYNLASKKVFFISSACDVLMMVFDFYCLLLSLPLILLELVFSKFMGIHSGMPDEVVENIKTKYEIEFGVRPCPEMKSELFWAIYLFVITRSETMRIRIEKFLTLYGFMRSMSVACYIVSLLFGIVVVNGDAEYLISKKFYMWSCYLFGVCSIVFMLRYYYLYNNYFSKTILRVFVYSSEKPTCACPQHVPDKE